MILKRLAMILERGVLPQTGYGTALGGFNQLHAFVNKSFEIRRGDGTWTPPRLDFQIPLISRVSGLYLMLYSNTHLLQLGCEIFLARS
jgi:hypothetical protein